MHVITFAAQKGGVGKTTLAVNLAVAAEAAGIKTALADLDPQESATAWAERRTAEAPHVEPVSERRLKAWLEAARGAGYGLAIIDTPPSATTEAVAAIQLADEILIPCRPSLIDIEAIRRTALLVQVAKATASVVFNAAPVSAVGLIEQAVALVRSHGLACAGLVVRERAVFRHSWTHGLGVVEQEPNGKAAQEIALLLNSTNAPLHN